MFIGRIKRGRRRKKVVYATLEWPVPAVYQRHYNRQLQCEMIHTYNQLKNIGRISTFQAKSLRQPFKSL
jgi:choline-glycine betaine transporter